MRTRPVWAAVTSLGRTLACAPIRLYQTVVSPLLPRSCRFTPSCSQYAIQAIERHGVIRGGALTATRVARCHPGHPGGYEPVPAKLARTEERNHGSEDSARRNPRHARPGGIPAHVPAAAGTASGESFRVDAYGVGLSGGDRAHKPEPVGVRQ
ncbi:MAG: membrane protein insertion efficiency factor YidD [Candidatus Eisenbacteria bacterium]|nr:membrane protein insertion efficiency factor YidD [Candidatus Eisenbacteria bacterium]